MDRKESKVVTIANNWNKTKKTKYVTEAITENLVMNVYNELTQYVSDSVAEEWGLAVVIQVENLKKMLNDFPVNFMKIISKQEVGK